MSQFYTVYRYNTLSLYFRSGVLAAALYNADTASLSVQSSVAELSPEFKMTKTLLHQV